MITSIKNIQFTTSKYSIQNKNLNECCRPKPQAISCDSVSFSGSPAAAVTNKLSEQNAKLIQSFAQKLKLNKLYKFETPAEQYYMTAIASKNNPKNRILFIQYYGYSKDNSTRLLRCAVSNSGQVYKDSKLQDKAKNVSVYNEILPQIINQASKELKY